MGMCLFADVKEIVNASAFVSFALDIITEFGQNFGTSEILSKLQIYNLWRLK